MSSSFVLFRKQSRAISVVANLKVAARSVIQVSAARVVPRQARVCWDRSIRLIKIGIDLWITRKRSDRLPIGEVVGVLGANDVNLCQSLRRRFDGER